MNCEPFDSPLWSHTKTFTGCAADLIPLLQRLQTQDWSKLDTLDNSDDDDWLLLTREIVDAYDLSPAVDLVLPWIIQLSQGRSPAELVLAWTVIGDIESARLMRGRTVASLQTMLEAAADLACKLRGRGNAPAQNEMAAAICLLPRLPEWARLMMLRLVVIGQRYAECLACGELLDVEWDNGWRVGESHIERKTVAPLRRDALELIKREAAVQGAVALTAVDQLAGVAPCAACGAVNDVIQLLAHPLEVPE